MKTTRNLQLIAESQPAKFIHMPRVKTFDELTLIYFCDLDHANELMLLQLPASLDLVHQAFNVETSEERMEVDDPKSQQQPSSSTALRPAPQQKHCLDGLPTGVEIGKLQLLKNGQTRLVIGDRVMDVQKAIPSQMFEVVFECFYILLNACFRLLFKRRLFLDQRQNRVLQLKLLQLLQIRVQ